MLAAIVQALTRFLWRLKGQNRRWRIYDNFLLAENRWHAMRYGMSNGMIDLGQRKLVPFADLIEELVELSTKHGILTPYTSFMADENTDIRDTASNARRADNRLELLAESSGQAGFAQRAAKAALKSADHGAAESSDASPSFDSIAGSLRQNAPATSRPMSDPFGGGADPFGGGAPAGGGGAPAGGGGAPAGGGDDPFSNNPFG